MWFNSHRHPKKPSVTTARKFVKSMVPSAFARKRDTLGIWDVFGNSETTIYIEYGFSLKDAWIDTAVRLGWTG